MADAVLEIQTGGTPRTSTDLVVNGATVTAPAGVYATDASKSVASGTAGTPTASKGTVSNHSIDVTPSVTNTAGYISGGTQTGTAVSVTASELVSGTYSVTSSGTKDVTNYASASVPSGTAGTPTATKGTVNNHAVTVTPSVTNSAGYITGGAKTGTGVSVFASELVSGSQTVTSNQTVDVTNLASITVDVPPTTPTLEAVTRNYTPTETAQSETVTPGTGYDGLSSVDISVGAISSTYVGTGVTRRDSTDLSASGATVTAPAGYYENPATNTIASGSATPPEVVGTGAGVTCNGTNLVTLSKVISLTPTVSPGYIASGTAANRNVVLSATMPVLGATTYPASTSDQTIAAGTYINGTQTFKAYAVQSKTFTQNGTYTPDNGFNGFYTVTVNVAGGSSNWTKLGSAEITANTTSTTAASAGTISCGSDAADKDAIIYVRVRDKAGKRAGYCAGSDAYFMNYNKANGSTSAFAVPAVMCYRYTTGNQWAGTAGQYGVYGYSISNAGVVTIRKRYNSNYSLTVNGTFTVEVYKLTYPTGSGPVFDM